MMGRCGCTYLHYDKTRMPFDTLVKYNHKWDYK
jgi:hypothetical protein